MHASMDSRRFFRASSRVLLSRISRITCSAKSSSAERAWSLESAAILEHAAWTSCSRLPCESVNSPTSFSRTVKRSEMALWFRSKVALSLAELLACAFFSSASAALLRARSSDNSPLSFSSSSIELPSDCSKSPTRSLTEECWASWVAFKPERLAWERSNSVRAGPCFSQLCKRPCKLLRVALASWISFAWASAVSLSMLSMASMRSFSEPCCRSRLVFSSFRPACDLLSSPRVVPCTSHAANRPCNCSSLECADASSLACLSAASPCAVSRASTRVASRACCEDPAFAASNALACLAWFAFRASTSLAWPSLCSRSVPSSWSTRSTSAVWPRSSAALSLARR
mmetsp:Transcript_67842/g.175854  ORF Transcript_67842/g.175854 Transcript_67842/m.175854 type:complete len:343 (+) Transcript_67842:2702-3730(+)